ncbi:MAG: formylglycine-generating enzyme family protein [Candidatus Thiodiazotropha sp. (ex Myrtea sp. 'scaly one' KF741663)]|nr:formylglycine-generating enzyme family protein [Candidatus Thiodiazotropha sp. (ex Myrtea sp. 'scaly one' KF741663)]
MFSKRDYWPYFLGVLIFGGGLMLPVILHLMAIPHEADHDGSLLMGLILCAPFLFSINRKNCSINFGKLIIAYLIMNYLALKIVMQGGDASALVFPGFAGILVFFLAGWMGVKIGHLVGYSKPAEKISNPAEDRLKRKIYLGFGVFISTLAFYVFFFGGGEPAPTASERLSIVEKMRQFPPLTSEKVEIPGGDLIMMTIPGGQFEMGSIEGEESEQPVHPVIIHPFKLSKYEITIAQWEACWDENVCKYMTKGASKIGGRYPIDIASYEAITKQYIPWLNKRLNMSFRLPTEAEWEYAARAGSNTKYSWGDDINHDQANYYNSDVTARHRLNKFGLMPVDFYEANAFGLHNMHGNVNEWVQDCWHSSYKTLFSQAPHDGSAWSSFYCSLYVKRGGSGGSQATYLRSATRGKSNARATTGFRLAHDIDETEIQK